MRIGLDVDGVLADFNTAYMRLIINYTGQDRFGPHFVIRTWEYPEDQAGYLKEDIKAVWESIKSSRSFWAGLEPFPRTLHALELAENFVARGHEVYYITSRVGFRAKDQTEHWLRQLGVKTPSVLICHDKGGAAQALDLHYYLDDKAENAMSVRVMAPNCQTKLLTQTWNDMYTIPGVKRVDSAEAFLLAL